MKSLKLIVMFLILFAAGCSSNEKGTASVEKKQDDVKTEETANEQSEDAEEETDPVWPGAFEGSENAFAFPISLAEAEEQQKGIWWEKIEDEDLSEEDLNSSVAVLLKAISNEEDDRRANLIKQFISDSFFPDLPPMSEFQPRGKINLEEVEEQSSIKLNGREMKEKINIAIILDASGSMKAVQNGKTLMDIAKESIQDFTSNLPENAQISLTVYGHKGTGNDEDKELSCNGIEEVYPLGRYEKDQFSSELQNINPSGWTSMGKSLEQVGEKLKQQTDSTNVIYLVSDGKETCDGNPAEAAKALAGSNIEPIINVIGLAVTKEDASELENIAKSGDGRYINAKTQQDLDQEFQESTDTIGQWSDWFEQNSKESSDQLQEDQERLIELNDETVSRLGTFLDTGRKVLIELNQQELLGDEVYSNVFNALEDFYNTMYHEKDSLYQQKFGEIEDTFNSTRKEMEDKFDEGS
ncbi:VWA domain-containing protein [Bacillus salacetis]|uniref:VWA domain-containing protein n=1 Tax=Bacillus salacetis TaxID=2315464 RepID=A0A3A1R1P3_9BACI|nr:VWA domain-containing protein [Bacillus salacetis]RIW32505.1 VWA domain-containing protein [Bacillus salacetis]